MIYSNESSVGLSWEKPDGNYDFYNVIAVSKLEEAEPVLKEVKEAQVVFDGLIQGNEYDFIIVTGVSSRDMWSENVSISQCTREFT